MQRGSAMTGCHLMDRAGGPDRSRIDVCDEARASRSRAPFRPRGRDGALPRRHCAPRAAAIASPAPGQAAATMAASSATIDLRAPEIVGDPLPTYETLRREGSVLFLPRHDYWIVLGHEAVRSAFARPEHFSNAPYRDVDAVLLAADPPEQTAMRRTVAKLFSPCGDGRGLRRRRRAWPMRWCGPSWMWSPTMASRSAAASPPICSASMRRAWRISSPPKSAPWARPIRSPLSSQASMRWRTAPRCSTR